MADRLQRESERIESNLNSLSQELTRLQLDFDLVHPDALAHARIEDGHVALGDELYDVLLIPYTSYMRREEYEMVRRIAKSVGTYYFYRSLDSVSENAPGQSNGVQFVPTEDLRGFVMRLRHAIDDGIHLSGHGRQDILLLQRQNGGTTLAFLVNQSGHPRSITARFEGRVRLTVKDPETGLSRPVESSFVRRKTQAAESVR